MQIEDPKLNELQEEARSLLVSLAPEDRVFVEFAGTPKSGKSACIDIVNHFFRRLDYKVLAPAEGASKRTPYYLKDNLAAFNAWSATYALSHILEGRYGSDQYHLVIMDRGLFDALAWFELLQSELLQSRGGVTAEECVTIQSFLLVGHWRKLIDLVFLFQTDPDTSLDRENRDKLIDEPGQAMNPAFLENLNRAYVTIKDKYAGQFNQLYDVDTGSDQKTTPQSTAYEVARNIVHHIRMKAEAHNAG